MQGVFAGMIDLLWALSDEEIYELSESLVDEIQKRREYRKTKRVEKQEAGTVIKNDKPKMSSPMFKPLVRIK